MFQAVSLKLEGEGSKCPNPRPNRILGKGSNEETTKTCVLLSGIQECRAQERKRVVEICSVSVPFALREAGRFSNGRG